MYDESALVLSTSTVSSKDALLAGDVVKWSDKRGTYRVLETFIDAGGPTAKLVAPDGTIRFARLIDLRLAGKRTRRIPSRINLLEGPDQ